MKGIVKYLKKGFFRMQIVLKLILNHNWEHQTSNVYDVGDENDDDNDGDDIVDNGYINNVGNGDDDGNWSWFEPPDLTMMMMLTTMLMMKMIRMVTMLMTMLMRRVMAPIVAGLRHLTLVLTTMTMMILLMMTMMTG